MKCRGGTGAVWGAVHSRKALNGRRAVDHRKGGLNATRVVKHSRWVADIMRDAECRGVTGRRDNQIRQVNESNTAGRCARRLTAKRGRAVGNIVWELPFRFTFSVFRQVS